MMTTTRLAVALTAALLAAGCAPAAVSPPSPPPVPEHMEGAAPDGSIAMKDIQGGIYQCNRSTDVCLSGSIAAPENDLGLRPGQLLDSIYGQSFYCTWHTGRCWPVNPDAGDGLLAPILALSPQPWACPPAHDLKTLMLPDCPDVPRQHP